MEFTQRAFGEKSVAVGYSEHCVIFSVQKTSMAAASRTSPSDSGSRRAISKSRIVEPSGHCGPLCPPFRWTTSSTIRPRRKSSPPPTAPSLAKSNSSTRCPFRVKTDWFSVVKNASVLRSPRNNPSYPKDHTPVSIRPRKLTKKHDALLPPTSSPALLIIDVSKRTQIPSTNTLRIIAKT